MAPPSSSNNAIYLAIIAAAVTVLGWFVTTYLKSRADDKFRRLQETTKFLERQIGEFYGPLFNLVNQILTCNQVQDNLIRPISSNHDRNSDINAIRKFFQEHYFIPLHKEFNETIKTKLHLIDGTSMPRSFFEYTRHAIQEHAQLSLWNEEHIDTSVVKGIPFPDWLYNDLKEGLETVMKKYARNIEILKEQSAVKSKKYDAVDDEEMRYLA